MTRRRRHRLGTVDLVGLDGAHLPLADQSVDAALCTFTLCTISDVHEALAELHRVLRPDGELHFLEHGRLPLRRRRPQGMNPQAVDT